MIGLLNSEIFVKPAKALKSANYSRQKTLTPMHIVISALVIWLVVTIGLAMLLNVGRIRRLNKLAKSRNSIDSFSQFYSALNDYPKDQVKEIHSALQKLVGFPRNFPLLPQDDLVEDLEVDLGNLDEFQTSVIGSDEKIELPTKAGALAKRILELRAAKRDIS
jgi:hypothetical protein